MPLTEPLEWATAPNHFRRAHAQLRADYERTSHLIEPLRREIAFLRALGAEQLDGSTGRSFASSYTGELSSEAIKTAWTTFLAEAVGALVGDGSLRDLTEASVR